MNDNTHNVPKIPTGRKDKKKGFQLSLVFAFLLGIGHCTEQFATTSIFNNNSLQSVLHPVSHRAQTWAEGVKHVM